MKPRLLVCVPNVWDRAGLAVLSDRYDFAFDGEELLEIPSLEVALGFDVFEHARGLAERHRGVAGVVGTGDYPGCLIAALVAHQLGLPSPPPQAVVQLSHKLYSRQIQAAAAAEATPRYFPIDPFCPPQELPLPFPFFVKPAKGTMSIAARRVDSVAAFEAALRFSPEQCLRGLALFRPFQQLLERFSDRRLPAHFFIGEELLEGQQVTVDGFVQDGRVTIMGVVDSVMYPGTISFERFEYPSSLPEAVQHKMAAISARVIAASGLDQTCFNVELFFDRTRGKISIIEVNPRMAYQFADLYLQVDGTSTYAIQCALATGADVSWQPGAGPQRAAASFVGRRFEDGVVLAVPGQEETAEVVRRFPGTSIKTLCKIGDRLSDHDQDPQSFRYAIVNIAAPTRETLFERYAEVERLLTFRFG